MCPPTVTNITQTDYKYDIVICILIYNALVHSTLGLTPLGLPSLCLLHLPSLGLLVILPLTPFGLLLVYPISLSMASWILGYGFMITCSVMPIMASV